MQLLTYYLKMWGLSSTLQTCSGFDSVSFLSVAGNCGTGMGVGSSFLLTLTYEASILWVPDAKSWHIWKDPDAGQDWGQEIEGDKRRWEGWMASLTQWTWICANLGRQWRTGKPGILQSMGLRRVGHDWAAEQWRTITLTYTLYKIRRSSFQGRVSPGWAGSVPCPVILDFPRNSQVKELDFIG